VRCLRSANWLFWVNRTSLIGEVVDAFRQRRAAHLCDLEPIHLVTEQGYSSTIPEALDAAVDLAVVEGLEDLVRLHAPPPED
jgi:hypothetical protein